MRTVYLILVILFLSPSVFAQINIETRDQKRTHIEPKIVKPEEGVIVFNKSFAGGPKITSDGYGAFLEWGRSSTDRTAWLFQIDFSERKHSKEEKIRRFYNTGRFIFGKVNFFYPLKLGVQQQLLLGNKGNKNGVQVTANYGGGIALGLLRPYYVQVPGSGGNLKYIKYNSADSTEFLNGQIYNGPTFTKGWDELSVVPGAYVKTALRFDYGAYNELIAALEVGVTAEYYTKGIQQLVYNDPKQFFFGAYFALVFGKRK